jgi:hypothetical protein
MPASTPPSLPLPERGLLGRFDEKGRFVPHPDSGGTALEEDTSPPSPTGGVHPRTRYSALGTAQNQSKTPRDSVHVITPNDIKAPQKYLQTVSKRRRLNSPAEALEMFLAKLIYLSSDEAMLSYSQEILRPSTVANRHWYMRHLPLPESIPKEAVVVALETSATWVLVQTFPPVAPRESREVALLMESAGIVVPTFLPNCLFHWPYSYLRVRGLRARAERTPWRG